MEKRILVIDDEEPIRKSFVLAFEDTDFILETASSGEEGLDKFSSKSYDLIFLDLKMPGMNGVETLREIRKKDKVIPIYIVTAFSKEFFNELRQLIADNIAFEVMQKPIGMEEIKDTTTAILSGADAK